MNKKVHRGFFSYLMIFLGIAVAFVAVCVVIMIFSPGTNVLGFSYFSESETEVIKEAYLYDENNEPIKLEEDKIQKIDINKANLDPIEINTIEINSNIFDVQITQKSSDNEVTNGLTIQYKVDTKGFAKGKSNKFNLLTKYFEHEKKLQINIEAPTGFINFANTSEIKIDFPMSYTISKNINIIANTQTGNILLGGEKTNGYTPGQLSSQSINLKTTSGNISTTDYFSVGNHAAIIVPNNSLNSSIATESGDVNFSAPIIANNVNLKTKSGEFTFSNETFVLSNNFKFEAENSFLTVKNLNAKNIEFASKNGKIYSNILKGDVVFSDKTNTCDLQVGMIDGSLLIGTLNEEEISTKTVVDVNGKITGKCNIFTQGSITIGEIQDTTVIRTKNGEVRIDKVNGELTLDTVSSKITLGKVVNDDGVLIGKGITSKVTINNTDNSNIETYFNTVGDGSSITNKKGTMTINLGEGSASITATGKNIRLDEDNQSSPFNYNYISSGNRLTLTSPEGTIQINTPEV